MVFILSEVSVGERRVLYRPLSIKNLFESRMYGGRCRRIKESIGRMSKKCLIIRCGGSHGCIERSEVLGRCSGFPIKSDGKPKDQEVI